MAATSARNKRPDRPETNWEPTIMSDQSIWAAQSSFPTASRRAISSAKASTRFSEKRPSASRLDSSLRSLPRQMSRPTRASGSRCVLRPMLMVLAD